MYRNISRAVVFGLVLGFMNLMASASVADESKAKPQEPSSKKVARFPFRGKIHAVDKEAKTITLDGKERKRTLFLLAETKIVKAGKPATLDDAVIGEPVGGLVARNAEGREEVISIRLGPKPNSSDPVVKKDGKLPKPAQETRK